MIVANRVCGYQVFGRMCNDCLKCRWPHFLRVFVAVPLFSCLAGCVSVELSLQKPVKPLTHAEAEKYLNQKDQFLAELNQQLFEQERACYDRFLVSDCVDAVRANRADYKRAHIEAEATANEIIRLQRYKKKLNEKNNPKPKPKPKPKTKP